MSETTRRVEAGEVTGADEARRRPRQDRLDRPGAGECRRDKCAVAAHHHQRGGDAAPFQESFGGGDQPVDHADEAGVEQRRQCAARPAEPGRQFVAGRHRQAGRLADQVAGGDLVSRVADGEIGADGEGRDGAAEFRQGRLERGQVERRGVAVDVVAAGAEHDRVAAERRLQPVAVEVGLGEADHHQRHAAALPLDQRVGGKRGGHRHQLDGGRLDLGRPEDGVGGAGDADGQVVAGGQRLGLGQKRAARLRPGRPQHGVGEGAAGVDA